MGEGREWGERGRERDRGKEGGKEDGGLARKRSRRGWEESGAGAEER